MNRNIITLFVLVLFLVGCGQKQVTTQGQITEEETESEQTGDASVDEVSSDIDEVDVMDEELVAAELEDLEKELEELDW